MKQILLLLLMVPGLAMAGAATSNEFALDIASGVRTEENIGRLAYDTLWQGVDNAGYRIKVNGEVLSSGSGSGTVAWHPRLAGDYSLTYEAFVDGVKVGTDLSAQFRISGKDLYYADITLSEAEVLYDGTARKPSVTVVYQEETLVEGVDYTLTYTNNITPGVATITISGTGRFEDVVERTFTIRPAGVCSLDIESGTRIAKTTEPLTYDAGWFGDPSSTYKMYLDGVDLSQGAGAGAYDWTPRAVGDHVVSYRSYSGGYLVSDEYQARFHVVGQDLVNATITFQDETMLYDGTARKPSITIVLGGQTLVEGVDYSLAYKNNVNPGVGAVTVTGLGSYVDILDVPFTIRPAGVCFLDIESGARESNGSEVLRYSSSWDGGSQQSARVRIAENGKTFAQNFGEGEVVWHASKVGTHVLTHTTYTNGIAGKVETATFVALNADPVPDVEAVQYVDFDGTVKSCTDWSPVSSSTLPAEWGFSGETTWYVADGDLTITNGTAQQGVDTVTVAGDVRLILKDGCDLKVLGWYGAAINVSGEGNSFTVYAQSDGNAMGKLTAEVVESSDSSSSKRGAGIGGGVLYTALQMSGNVTINGGHVCARGGMKCAGIGGGGRSYHATNIVINAGVVNASSPDEQWGAAGIGAGRLSPAAGHASDIQIHGGRVMASGSVGIGGSCGSRYDRDGGVRHVVISGGWISARGSHGAGIGGGSSSFGRSFDCDDILISGGHVEAYGGRGGAGIGGGGDALDDEGGNCNRIVITGGEVIAIGSESGGYAGAGIGGGGTEDARCDNVLITGGSVLAIGGNASASGVGGLSGTNVIISTVLTIKADGNNPPTTVIANGGGDLAEALKGKQYFTAAKMLEDDDLPDEEVDDDTDDPDMVKNPDAVFSTYDYVGVYDGAVHTIDTNALVAAYAAAMGGEVTVVYAGDESGVRGAAALPAVLSFKDVVATCLWYKVSAPGYYDVVHPCKVLITNRAVTVTSGTKTDFEYDGKPHAYTNLSVTAGSFVVGEGIATSNWATVTTVAQGTVDNAFDFAAFEGTKLGNYAITVVTGKIAVVKGALPPGGGDPGTTDPGVDVNDPGQVKDPTVAFSPWDYVGVYDGEAHTIDTNALRTAYAGALGGDVTVAYAGDESGVRGAAALSCAPAFRDVVATTVWYRVSSANYADVVHAAKVLITNRAVTVTSGTKTDFVYDGKPHAYTNLSVTAGSFVVGEGIATSNWATVTTVAQGQIDNAFDFEVIEGTKLGNYAITVVTGKIAVAQAGAVIVTITGRVANAVYDGTKKSVAGYDIVSISDPLYTAADFTFSGVASTNATDAGTYPMGLKTGDFANANGNFASVTFNVTDGSLIISQAANEWTTEPAIAGWTYGEAAKTPVGAAKFGSVSFTYSPTSVGAAGDYVMTASVAGTANYTGLSSNVTFTIAKATVPGGDDPGTTAPGVDPTDPENVADPEVAFSSWDYVGVYDGASHTIDTNALRAAYVVAMGGDVTVAYAGDESGVRGAAALPCAPAFRDVVATTVWYRVSSANYADVVHAAKVLITNRAVTVMSGTKTDFVYDGKPHAYTNLSVTAGSFVVGEGIATSNWATVTTVAQGQIDNAFDFAPQAGTKLDNYAITVVTGKIAVVKGTVPPGGEDPGTTDPGVDVNDPEQMKDPNVAFSDWDYVGVYDGEAHTIDTNALRAAYVEAMGEDVAVTFGAGGGLIEAALPCVPAFRDVVATTVWYRVSSANYADVVHAAKVLITNRAVTVTSGTKTDFVYDGKPHAYTNLSVTAGSFVVGEGIATSNWATVTTVAQGQIDNAFDFEVIEGTKLGNYAITVVTGKIAVVKGTVGPGGGEEPGSGDVPAGGVSKFDATYLFDGEGHTINTQALFAVTLVGATPSFSFSNNVENVWVENVPTFTNAGKYVVWYRISAANYEDYIHAACVTITNKPVRVVSAEAHQRYPWNGLVDIVVKVDGESNDVARVDCSFAATNTATQMALPVAHVTRKGIVGGSGRDWTLRFVWNAATDLGEVEVSNVVLFVGAKLLGVQLWKDGPYWAECNVGATTSDEYGYYFWWGDTVGYSCEGGKWEDGFNYSDVTWVSSSGTRMISSPFESSTCPTYGKGNPALQSLGYIDSEGNLVAEHDAATVHLGAPWRMPIDDELAGLISNCTTETILTNSAAGQQIYGWRVTGKGSYASKSIVFRRGGWAESARLRVPYLRSVCWSSTLTDTYNAWGADFGGYDAIQIRRIDTYRYLGLPVRPVWGLHDGEVPTVIEPYAAESPGFKLSTKEGIRSSFGSETLRYSTLWDGGTNETAKVTLSQGDTTLAVNLTGEGDYNWSVAKPGLYTLTHSTYTNGAVAKTLTAKFNVSGVPVDPAEIVVTPYEAQYDGVEHGISVVGPEGTVVKYCATSNGVYDVAVTFKDVCATQIWYEVSGGGYLVYTNSASLKIAPRPVTITSGTKTDFVYDGTAHEFSVLIKSENGFVAGEGIATSNWATVTTVTEGDVANSFDYVPLSGTKLSNYDLTVVTGKIAVVQAENVWTTDPAIAGWTYGEAAKTPVGAAKFGSVSFAYSPTPVGAAGDYVMTASVAGTANYTGLSSNVTFTIAKATVPGGNDPGAMDPDVDPTDPEDVADLEVAFSSWDYVGVYDGEAHTIDTNALRAAYVVAMGGDVTVVYGAGGGLIEAALPCAPAFRDVVATTVWYRVSSANYADVVHAAKVLITGRCVTVASGTKTDFVYDGKPHAYTNLSVTAGSFVAGEGIATSNWATVTTVAQGAVDNVFDFAPLEGTKLGNYAITVVTGKIAVVKGALPPEEDDPGATEPGVDVDDPGQVKDPTVAFSPWDYVGVYDGESHTIDTNALRVAYAEALGGDVTVVYAGDECGVRGAAALPCVPTFKDVVATTVWYRVSSANYADVVHAAKVLITNRAVTVASGTKLDFAYDGKPHAYTNLSVTAGSFVAGEGIATSNWATVTTVTQGVVDNAFDFAPQAGTKLGNYAITVVTGKIAVVKGTVSGGDDPGTTDPGVDPTDPEDVADPEVAFSDWDYVGVYDGEAHTIDTNALRAAYAEALGGDVTVVYGAGGGLIEAALPCAPMFKDVVATTVWYRVSSANYADVVHAAKVLITGRCVTVTSGTKLDFAYDGKPHAYTNLNVTAGSFVVGEGIATSNWATVTTVAQGAVDNAFDFAPLAGTKLGNYAITVVTGKIAVVKGTLPSGDDDPGTTDPGVDPTDPEDVADPEVAFSDWDYMGVYDGEAHTIDTNALRAAYAEALGAGVSVTFGAGGGLIEAALPCAPAFRDVVATTVWYRVSSANYADVVHAAKVLITNRTVTVTSGTKTDFAYDGKPHAYTNLSVTAGSFVAGEGIATSNWATVTTVAQGAVDNAFDFAPLDGTKLDNYAITVVTGKIAMVKATVPGGDDPGTMEPGVDVNDPENVKDPNVAFSDWDYVGVYDGEAHTIDTNALCAAYAEALGGDVTVAYAGDESGVRGAAALPCAPAFREVVATTVWYRVSSANYADVVHAAKVLITGRCVTVTSGTKTDFAYDGAPHAYTNLSVTAGSFAAGEGIVTSNWATVTTVAQGAVDNAFDFAPQAGTKLENYAITVVTGKIAVVKGALPPGGDDPGATVDPGVDPTDPEDVADPEVAFSDWDYVGVYDGEAHTIDTNALRAAYAEALGAGVSVTFGAGGGLIEAALPCAPAFRDVVATTVWYRVSSANYADVVHAAKVLITGRCVTVTSGTKTDFAYDGKPHAYTNLSVTAGSFVAGEGIATSNWAMVVAESEGLVDNTFDYVPLAGTRIENYALTIVFGKIAAVGNPVVTTTKVSFEAMGGTVSGRSVVTQELQSTYGELPVPTRDDHLFGGWFASPSGTGVQAQSQGAFVKHGDHVLYAKWTVDATTCDVSIFKWEAIGANCARILGFVNPAQQTERLVIPDMIDGKYVTEIAPRAFASSQCGAIELVLPVFCTNIGEKAFTTIKTTANAPSLKKVVFASARKWNDPTQPAAVTIGAYAFSSETPLEELTLPAEIASIGNYAFMNCRRLGSITILGRPDVGNMPFRSCGMDVGGVTVHLDPALAADADYMARLKQNLPNVTVRTDAVVTGVSMSSVAMKPGKVVLTLSVDRAAAWGAVDASAIRVEHLRTLDGTAETLTPSACENADGTVTLEVSAPVGETGFLRTILVK